MVVVVVVVVIVIVILLTLALICSGFLKWKLRPCNLRSLDSIILDYLCNLIIQVNHVINYANFTLSIKVPLYHYSAPAPASLFLI